MEALVCVALKQPQGMSNKEFFGLWSQEARAALEAVAAGAIKSIYKVAGKYEVLVIVSVESGDQIDELVHSMPIWAQGYSHLVKEIEWTLLRPYENWAKQLEGLAEGG